MRKEVIIFLVLAAALLLRLYLYFNKTPVFREGDRVRITSRITAEPVRYEYSQYVKLQNLKIYLPLYPEVSYGDIVVVEGVVAGDRLKNPVLISSVEPEGIIYSTRRKLLDFYKMSLPEPHSSLIAGVTIGSKSGIPAYFWEQLKKTGTAHIIVASGMNVALVAGFLLGFFTLFFKRNIALIFVICGIWIYSILSGFDAPIVRAAIMGSLTFTAQELGRLSFSLRVLILTAFLMLFAKPLYFIDIGYWLSFTATLGIILFSVKFKHALAKVRLLRGSDPVRQTIITDFSTTLAAQAGVTPVLFFAFGQFNLFSPIINVLVLWCIVPITLIGMTGGVTGLFIPLIGKLFLYLTYPLTLWFVTVVNIFG